MKTKSKFWEVLLKLTLGSDITLGMIEFWVFYWSHLRCMGNSMPVGS